MKNTEKNILDIFLSIYNYNESISCFYPITNYYDEKTNIIFKNDLEHFKSLQFNVNDEHSFLVFYFFDDISHYLNNKLVSNLLYIEFEINDFCFIDKFYFFLNKLADGIELLESNINSKIKFNTYLTHLTNTKERKSDFQIKCDIVVDDDVYIFEYEYNNDSFNFYTYKNKELIVEYRDLHDVHDNFIFYFYMKKQLYKYINIVDISEEDLILNKSEYLNLLEMHKIN